MGPLDSSRPSDASTADESIQIVDYDPEWPARFEEERTVLAQVIGRWVVGGIHHVGSTSVPGLNAKPIIDILVGVRSLEQSRDCFVPVARLGYLYAPYLSAEMHWFCKPHPARRTHHLHLVPLGSQRYVQELAFRDRLRTNSEIAQKYGNLKKELATRFVNDREGYTEAKTDFIRRVLEQP
jgi:GrpB-like predicted nucleotidyltransferase (UPF0157 family)